MALIGFDADQDVSRVAVLAVERGVRFVMRYLKNLTRAEVAAIFAAGATAGVKVGVGSIFETTAKRALAGAEAGAEDAQKALTQAAALGQPEGGAIFPTADFDATPEQQPAVVAYFAAFHAGVGNEGRMGDYANGAVEDACIAAGCNDIPWLAGGMGMRGSRAFLQAGREAIVQDVGDKRGLNLGISIDSDYAPTANEPEDIGCWTAFADVA
jgi:hypothetical protein